MVTFPGQTQPDSGPGGTRSELLTHAVLASRPGILSDSATSVVGSLIPLARLLAMAPPKRTSVEPRRPSLMLCSRLRGAEVSPKVTENKSLPQYYCYAARRS